MKNKKPKMGNPKLKWTPEEEKALREGVHKHGVSRWQLILTDPQFNHILRCRSNIELKDQWRNMNHAKSRPKPMPMLTSDIQPENSTDAQIVGEYVARAGDSQFKIEELEKVIPSFQDKEEEIIACLIADLANNTTENKAFS